MQRLPGRPVRALATAGALLVTTLLTLVLGACSTSPAPDTHTAAVTTSAPAAQAADPAASVAAAARPARAHPTPAPATSSTSSSAAPRPVVNHCRDNFADQKVMVSLRLQHMWLCARHRTVYDNAITSGMAGQYTETPRGDYWIQGRNTDTTLTLNTGATYAVRYWIPFDAPLYGFHDSSWQRFPYGSAKYRTDGSHGCIHMPLRAIAFLYRWVARPTSVHIG